MLEVTQNTINRDARFNINLIKGSTRDTTHRSNRARCNTARCNTMGQHRCIRFKVLLPGIRWGVPRESRESPRGPHRESRQTLGRPREHPEGLQTAPEGTPRSPQGALGTPQGGCKYTPRHPKGHQRGAKGSPTRPGSPDACYLQWFRRVP